MRQFSYGSCVISIALSSAFALQAVAAPSLCSSGIANNTGSSEWTPTSDFTINGDGTVTHLRTGLTWKRCVEGLTGVDCLTGFPVAQTWAAALNLAVAANNSKYAGYMDWRLPNKKELESIIDLCGVSYDTVNKVIFPRYFYDVWTSTTLARDPTIAFSVNFTLGTTRVFNLKTETLQVRLVRAGRTVDSADLLQP